MFRSAHRPHRTTRYITWTSLVLVLSAGPVQAASPVNAPPAQAIAQLTQTQNETAPRRQPAQEVSDALGQRLDQMILTSKPATAR
jgi:hypothetical protein